MGICASSTPMGSNNSKKGAADPVVKKVIRKSGASKYGPYRCVEVAGEKKWTNSLRKDAPSFDTEGDLFFYGTNGYVQFFGNLFLRLALVFSHKEYSPALGGQLGDGTAIEVDFFVSLDLLF